MNALHNLDLFAQATLSIVLEAVPFLLLGSVASGLVEAYVPRDRLTRLLPKGRLASTLVGLGIGALTPCCECGVVFLARRLIGKGVPPGAAVAFMLAAPVINPVSLLATLVAFRGDPTMAIWRCVLVIAAGLVVGYWAGGRDALSLLRDPAAAPACGCGHDHGPEDHAHHHGPATIPGTPFGSLADAVPLAAVVPSRRDKVASAMRHAMADFLDMAKVLILGSMVAAAFKAYVPVSVVMALENDLVLAIPGMMALAVVLSLCSQADAFVAASFSTFPAAAKLAFLALGPMLDLKLLLMWRQVFTPRLTRVLAIVPAAIVFITCAVYGILTGGAS
ncbi:permease [Solidesulfovibrio magneticus]|uniref:ABC transporter permease protein n=1 Tax=Solidesulfovibrio magneticus (strain ATCC 700980 / DSM 13731 / RS-1) TaxID=573370 RepID=C4XMJ3_SOLM1|nr:permease [Solidesulfovibrio magneticus]BAH74784.1 putative ABC transporter permease protein [Solidesulfovibrio magneticus RS-1]